MTAAAQWQPNTAGMKEIVPVVERLCGELESSRIAERIAGSDENTAWIPLRMPSFARPVR